MYVSYSPYGSFICYMFILLSPFSRPILPLRAPLRNQPPPHYDGSRMKEAGYPHRFINQYARIPSNISGRLDAGFPAEYPGVRHCLGLIVTNLLGYGPVAYSRRDHFFTGHRTAHYTKANMLRAVDIAVNEGYAESGTGFRSAGYRRGISSTLAPTARLRREFRPLGKVELDVALLPLMVIDSRQVFGADDIAPFFPAVATSPKRQGPAPPPPTTYDATYRLNREYFNRMRIDYRNLNLEREHLEVVGLTRVFRGGGVGRWFQKGGLSYQQLSGEERSRLLLDGEEVVELDYPAMHPHLLYAWEGRQCPEGFYDRVAALCGCSRFVAKSVTLFALNAPSYASLSSAVNLDMANETRANEGRAAPKPILYHELKKLGLKARDVTNAIEEAHPTVAEYLFSNSAGRLMLAESEIVTSALLKLMGMGIPALPVHDSLVVPKRHGNRVRRVMEDAYREHTGFGIAVE